MLGFYLNLKKQTVTIESPQNERDIYIMISSEGQHKI